MENALKNDPDVGNIKNAKLEFLLKAAIAFVIIASLSNVLDVIGLKSISKIFQLLITAIYLIIVAPYKKKNDRERNMIANVSLAIIIYLILRFLLEITIVKKWSAALVFICFSQLFFLYFWIFVSFITPHTVLKRLLWYIERLFMAGFIFALLEFVIPVSARKSILSAMYAGNVPPSYFSRDFFSDDALRLGSFYLSPLTFAFTCLFSLCIYRMGKMQKGKWIFTAVITILAKTKSSLLGGSLFLLGKKARYVNTILMILVLVIIFYLPFAFDGWTFYYNYDDTAYKSTANHISGLVFGMDAGFEKPFWGNGLGTAGFVAYVETLSNKSISHSPFDAGIAGASQNGNESLLGVIGYQLGGAFVIIHLLLFALIFWVHMKQQNYIIASFVILSILFQAFTESSLTILVSSCQALLFAKTLIPLTQQYKLKHAG